MKKNFFELFLTLKLSQKTFLSFTIRYNLKWHFQSLIPPKKIYDLLTKKCYVKKCYIKKII